MNDQPRNHEQIKTESYEMMQRKLYSILGGSHSKALDAKDYLEQHPEIYRHKTLVIDLIYEEFCRKSENGDLVDEREFARQFPGFEKSILYQIAIHKIVEPDQKLTFQNLEEQDIPQVGDVFLGFKLVSELGRGAFARVFHGIDRSLERQVVVKVCFYGAEEAKTLARLAHNNIVPVHSVTCDDKTELTAICMPFLGSCTLLDLIDSNHCHRQTKRLGKNESIAEQDETEIDQIHLATREWMTPMSAESFNLKVSEKLLEVLSALEYVHTQGFCHGDIKPSNVLLSDNGKAMLLDFNLSRSNQEQITHGGTLPYMAPEQLRPLFDMRTADFSKIGPRADLFQFGATFYELLTGQLPFGDSLKGDSVSSVAKQLYERQKQSPRKICDLAPRVDNRIAGLIESCLCCELSERPSSARALISELESYSKIRSKLQRFLATNFPMVSLLTVACLVVVSVFFIQSLSYVDNQFREGLELQQIGSHSDAVVRFSNVLAKEPELKNVQFLRAISFAREEEFRLAIDDLFEVSKEKEDGRAEAFSAYCMFFANEPRDRVISWFQQSIKKGYKNEYILSNLGYVYLRSSSLTAARNYLEAATQMNPSLLAAFISLSELEVIESYQQRKKPDLSFINRAIEISDKHGETYFHASELYSRAALFSDGIEKKELTLKSDEFCKLALEKGVNEHQLRQLIQIQTSLFGPIKAEEFKDYPNAKSNTKRIPRMLNPIPQQEIRQLSFLK